MFFIIEIFSNSETIKLKCNLFIVLLSSGMWSLLSKVFSSQWLAQGYVIMTSCSIYKVRERNRNGGRLLQWWNLSSQVTSASDEPLHFWRWLNTCLPLGSNILLPFLALPVYAALPFPVKLPLCQPVSSPSSTLPILSPVLLVGQWVDPCVELGCWLGLNHSTLSCK